MNNKGTKNNNFKYGIYCTKHYCITCHRPISINSFLYGSKKCKSCIKLGKGQYKKFYCKECGKEISYNRTRCRSCNTIYMWKTGIFKTRDFIGLKNPNWKKGITKLYRRIRNHKKYKNLIHKVFERDNFICQKCFKKGNILHAHHKLLFSFIIKLYNIKTLKQALDCKLLWDINWLITLCSKCHQIVHPEYNLLKEHPIND